MAVPTADSSWQRLWFSTLRTTWHSIAIVPLESGIDAHKVAEGLVAISREHGAKALRLVNGVGAQPSQVSQIVDVLTETAEQSESMVVPVDPLQENPSAIPIMRAASGILLVVRLGQSQLAVARRAVETVGADRIMGTIVVG
jgi:hypothetical protein